MRIKIKACKGSSTSPDGGGIFSMMAANIFSTKTSFPEA
jgi:hypothetical protein